MKKVKIKKGDEVLVTAGRSKGVRGRVMRVMPASNTAIVEHANMVKKHERANPNRQVKGGILEREAPIDISNLQLICPESGKPTRVGRKRLEDGSGARVAKKSGAVFS
jgi:large subunit ribosomal protein L24